MQRPMNTVELKDVIAKSMQSSRITGFDEGYKQAREDMINEIKANLNDRDRYWKGLMRAIDLIGNMKGE